MLFPAGLGRNPVDGSDTNSCSDTDPAFLRRLLQPLSGLLIQLTPHQHRQHLQNRNRQPRLAKLPRRLQPEHAAADHHRASGPLHQFLQPLHIGQPPDDGHFRKTAARNRRYEAFASQRIDQPVIRIPASAGQLHLLPDRVDAKHLLPRQRLNALLPVPRRILDPDPLLRQPGRDPLCQHRTVIRKIRLIGNHQNLPGMIPRADLPGRVITRRAVSQNHIAVPRIPSVFTLQSLCRNKMLPSHSAHRTDVKRSVEDLPAHQAPYQLSCPAPSLIVL